jgi:hypothetical protein
LLVLSTVLLSPESRVGNCVKIILC